MLKASAFYQSTKRRLDEYGVFEESILHEIASFADTQRNFATYQDFFQAMGVGSAKIYSTPSGDAVPYIDIPARQPEVGVIVIHASMMTALDENQRYQLATIAGTNPEYRVIGFGNPSDDQYYVKGQGLTFFKRLKIIGTRKKYPLVAAELAYLRSQGIRGAYHIGYSYGALKAAIAALSTSSGQLAGLLLVDPVAKPRPILKLLKDFKKTYEPLGTYVNQTNLKAFHEARGQAAKNRAYNTALLRPINRTIGWILSRVDIVSLLRRNISAHPAAKFAVAWGTESELGDDARLRSGTKGMITFRLRGAKHAFANDIHLHAAIIRQFLMR